MKLEHIIEARYYRKHSALSVYARLVSISGTVFEKMAMTSPVWLTSDQNAVTARFYAYDADSEQEAINQVQALLQRFGIPYSELGSVVEYGNRQWRVTMIYGPDRIAEARYYRRHTLKQIEQRLKELSRETVRDDVYVADQAIVDGKVHADVYVYGIDDENDVEETIERFLDHHGIPFTRIWQMINVTRRHEAAVYTATMTYDPEQIADRELTEARYYGKPSEGFSRNSY